MRFYAVFDSLRQMNDLHALNRFLYQRVYIKMALRFENLRHLGLGVRMLGG